jgi:uncharacterized membrane protein
MSHIHYLPLAPGFFAILVGFFFLVLILRSVRYAYESLGVSSNTAIFLLFAKLIGSFFNIPITELPPEHAMPTITSISLACVMPCLALAMAKARWLRSISAVPSFRR